MAQANVRWRWWSALGCRDRSYAYASGYFLQTATLGRVRGASTG
jgi:hypothetical protein